jgi:hypothetical protein
VFIVLFAKDDEWSSEHKITASFLPSKEMREAELRDELTRKRPSFRPPDKNDANN